MQSDRHRGLCQCRDKGPPRTAELGCEGGERFASLPGICPCSLPAKTDDCCWNACLLLYNFNIIFCHIARNTSIRSLEKIKIPDLKKFIELNENLASVIGTYPKAKVVGVALNTTLMSQEDAENYIEIVEKETGIPATDVIRLGGNRIFSQLL